MLHANRALKNRRVFLANAARFDRVLGWGIENRSSEGTYTRIVFARETGTAAAFDTL
jgi:hypothetical protein